MDGVYNRYIKSTAWREKRKTALKLDGGSCTKCGSDKRIEVHHTTYRRFGSENPEDIVTVCHECHEKLTATARKKRKKTTPIKIKGKTHYIAKVI